MLYYPLPFGAHRLHPDSPAYAAALALARQGEPRHKRPVYPQRGYTLARFL